MAAYTPPVITPPTPNAPEAVSTAPAGALAAGLRADGSPPVVTVPRAATALPNVTDETPAFPIAGPSAVLQNLAAELARDPETKDVMSRVEADRQIAIETGPFVNTPKLGKVRLGLSLRQGDRDYAFAFDQAGNVWGLMNPDDRGNYGTILLERTQENTGSPGQGELLLSDLGDQAPDQWSAPELPDTAYDADMLKARDLAKSKIARWVQIVKQTSPITIKPPVDVTVPVAEMAPPTVILPSMAQMLPEEIRAEVANGEAMAILAGTKLDDHRGLENGVAYFVTPNGDLLTDASQLDKVHATRTHEQLEDIRATLRAQNESAGDQKTTAEEDTPGLADLYAHTKWVKLDIDLERPYTAAARAGLKPLDLDLSKPYTEGPAPLIQSSAPNAVNARSAAPLTAAQVTPDAKAKADAQAAKQARRSGAVVTNVVGGPQVTQPGAPKGIVHANSVTDRGMTGPSSVQVAAQGISKPIAQAAAALPGHAAQLQQKFQQSVAAIAQRTQRTAAKALDATNVWFVGGMAAGVALTLAGIAVAKRLRRRPTRMIGLRRQGPITALKKQPLGKERAKQDDNLRWPGEEDVRSVVDTQKLDAIRAQARLDAIRAEVKKNLAINSAANAASNFGAWIEKREKPILNRPAYGAEFLPGLFFWGEMKDVKGKLVPAVKNRKPPEQVMAVLAPQRPEAGGTNVVSMLKDRKAAGPQNL